MMYTTTRGPSKLVTQRRTGPTQQIESKANDPKHFPALKIVFHRLNGKRFHGSTSQKVDSTTVGFSPAHEDNVRFVYGDFVPIDLEDWWAQRFLANIANLS